MSTWMHGRGETGSRKLGVQSGRYRTFLGQFRTIWRGLRIRDIYSLIVLEARRYKPRYWQEDPPSDALVEDHSASSSFRW